MCRWTRGKEVLVAGCACRRPSGARRGAGARVFSGFKRTSWWKSMTSMRSMQALTSFSVNSASPSPCLLSFTKSDMSMLKMAFVGCVIRMRPRKLVCPTTKGTAAQWSRWKCVISMQSTVLRSTSSKYGSDAMPAYPGWTPQSNMTLLPLYLASTHDRPTSEPAPRGMISSMSSPSVGAPVAAMDRFIPADISMGSAAMSAGACAGRSDLRILPRIEKRLARIPLSVPTLSR